MNPADEHEGGAALGQRNMNLEDGYGGRNVHGSSWEAQGARRKAQGTRLKSFQITAR
jgi:hypothetical protein